MEKHYKKEEEKSYIRETNGETKFYVDIFVTTLLQQYMGVALDLARISPMSDRQLTQFSRKMKDECYRIAENSAKILKASGYELGGTE